jgi:hypothetical protein
MRGAGCVLAQWKQEFRLDGVDERKGVTSCREVAASCHEGLTPWCQSRSRGSRAVVRPPGFDLGPWDDTPATTQTRRSPSAVRPAGHETVPASSRKSASTAPRPTARPAASPATGSSQARGGKGNFGPGHAVGR